MGKFYSKTTQSLDQALPAILSVLLLSSETKKAALEFFEICPERKIGAKKYEKGLCLPHIQSPFADQWRIKPRLYLKRVTRLWPIGVFAGSFA